MGSDWNTVSIDEIKSPEKYSCVGGPFGSSLSQKHYSDSGVPVIRGVNLSGDMFTESDFVFVSQEKAKELHRNMAFRGDIVFTQRGTLGQVAIIPEDSKYEQYIVSQSQMKLTVDPQIADSYFIYSYFRTRESKTLIEKNAIVGGVPHINLGILKSLQLKLPPIAIQKRISEISKTIDNKITLNRQINQTLEQMAQTLFKSWFVDFDPVLDNALDAGFFERNPEVPDELKQRAQQRQEQRQALEKDATGNTNHATGRVQSLPESIRQRFPSEFEESELGWVPKGWGVGTLSDVASYTSDRVSTEKLTLSNYISTENMLVDKKGVVDAANLPTVKTVPAYVSGNILISNIRPYFKKIWMANGQGGHSNDVLGFVSKEDGTSEYIFNLLYQDALFDFMLATSKGSKMPRGDKKAILNWGIVLAPINLSRFFSVTVREFYVSASARHKENETLTQLRDTLLPKLISGELRLDDVAAMTEEATTTV